MNALHQFHSLENLPVVERAVSLGPLFSTIPLDTKLTVVDWVIVGGESGPGARPMDPAWVEAVHDICLRDGVVFFSKQWGGFHKNAGGSLLDGRTWDEMPVAKMA